MHHANGRHGGAQAHSDPERRQQGRRRYALGVLAEACARIQSTGPGLRNVTLNSEAVQVAHFIGSRDLTEEEAARALKEAARAARIPEREAVATLRSAFRAGAAEPAFGSSSAHQLEQTLPDSHHDHVIRWLSDRCPLDSRPDVMAYLSKRRLLHGAIALRCFSLPPLAAQQALIGEWRKACGDERVMLTGLLARDKNTNDPIWQRFSWGDQHPLAIPWRNPSGHVYAVQRRRIDQNPERKYLFPWGRRVQWPLGAEVVANAPKDARVVIVEGPTDTMAMHQRLVARMRQGVPATLVLGKSQGQGWRHEWTSLVKDRDVFVAVDADKAGQQGQQTITDMITGRARRVRLVQPQQGKKDWAE